eukprot:jgi/Hompol1/293/HPOL_005275-RA
MKILNRRKIQNLDMVARLKREVQYLKLLRHPHIIKLYEVISTPTDIILVMEYAGGELFNYIVDKGRVSHKPPTHPDPSDPSDLFDLSDRLTPTDLKPENVLMDDYKNIKIADFGLSNVMNDGDFLKTSCGSPNYAAPEVISGKLYAGPEIDIWSCGVILYVMLCGRLPFDDEYIPNLFKKINGGIFTLPPFLSQQARDLVSAMLIVDPLKRITIPEIRRNEWFMTDLPEYLQPRTDIPQDSFAIIDEELVQYLQKKMSFSKETIHHALREPGNNQIKVAYQLVLDQRQMVADGKMDMVTSVKGFFSSSPPAWNNPAAKEVATPPRTPGNSQLTKTPSPIIGTPSSAASSMVVGATGTPPLRLLRSNRSLEKLGPTIPVLSSSVPKVEVKKDVDDHRRSKARSRWHYGIRSKSDPLDIMLEIYRAVGNVGMKWKTLDPFKIRCIYTTSRELQVKVEIQLFQIEHNSYLVDFRNVTSKSGLSSEIRGSEAPSDGSCGNTVFAFFDACIKLITELTISA